MSNYDINVFKLLINILITFLVEIFILSTKTLMSFNVSITFKFDNYEINYYIFTLYALQDWRQLLK